MAKRMTDTDKWKKKFIRLLPTKYKILWFFITDDCDHAGIWHVDFEAAELYTGEKFKQEDAIKYLGRKIHIFDNGQKWYIPSFVDFQYGVLKETNNVHVSVIQRLEKYGLMDLPTTDTDENEGLASPLQGAKDKDKDKVQDKDKDKRKETPEKLRYGEHVLLTPEEYEKLIIKLESEERLKRAIDILDNYIGSSGKKYKSHYHTILGWVTNELEKREKQHAANRSNNSANRRSGAGGATTIDDLRRTFEGTVFTE